MSGARYDAVVIGAGLGGLTSAACLAKRGLRVLVLEAREQVGGLAATEELVPGVRCDTVDHELGWMPERLVAHLGLRSHGLELLRGDPTSSALLPGGEVLSLYADQAATAEQLSRYARADGAAWQPFCERVAKLSSFLRALYEVPAPSLFARGAANVGALLGLGRKARALGRDGIFDVLRSLPMSVADFLDDTFEHAGLKGLLAARGVLHLLQGPRSGATAFLFLHHHVGAPLGAVGGILTARGGVAAAAQALARAAAAHGATIRCGAAVSRIAVRDERVQGLVLADGEEIAASRIVSSLDPRHTMFDLLEPEHVDPDTSRDIGNVRFRGATAKVNLVLDGPLPLGARNAAVIARGPMVVAPSMGYLERAFDCAKHGRMSDEPALELRVPGALDPSLIDAARAANRTAVSVIAQWAPYTLVQGEWDVAQRDALGDRVLAVLEHVLPGTSARVVDRQIVTPRDIEQRFGATGGSLTHGELTLDQVLFMRPTPALSRYATPIGGLYLCGRGCHPGMPLASGLLAAREVLRERGSPKGAATVANQPAA
ncbi:MAG: phytoene desaturase family protein [Gemmatimonadaceae bacterium]